ncbi:MAG: ABC transporter ATP-binding protein [Chitinophagaceae bacterium]
MIDVTIKKRLHFSAGNKDLEVSHRISPGCFLSVCGKSGAGKTTLLRILAGLTDPDSGRITAGGTVWYDGERRVNIKPQQRDIGFVFQDFALFPNMTVKQNLEFSLPDKKNRSRVGELLELTGLSGLASRRTHQLSGGQQQRVALARALVRQPKLLLMDEPLSALDHDTRVQLQEQILHMHKQFGLTSILVSHDNDEIIRLSDYVIRMDSGIITGQGTPEEVFQQPVSNRFRLEGIVTEIIERGIHCTVRIQSGDICNEFVLDQTQVAGLQTGDRIVFTAGAFDPVIKVIG